MGLDNDTIRDRIITKRDIKGGETIVDASLIGKKLRKLRGDTPLNIVSQKTGLGATAISNYENGIRIPRDEAKVALAKYYRKTILH